MQRHFHWHPSPRSPIILGGILCLCLWGFAVFSAREMTERLIVATADIQVQMAEQVRLIGIILQRSSDLERKARLVILLSDPSIREPYERESYEKSRAAYQKSMNDLAHLVLDPEVILIVQELMEEESLIHRQMEGLEGHSNVPPSLDQAFSDFNERTMTLAMRLDAEARGALVKNVSASRQLLKNYQFQNSIALLSALTLIALVYSWTKRLSHLPPAHDDD
jgi:two-component system sensor histidine kinase GlrK